LLDVVVPLADSWAAFLAGFAVELMD